MWCGRAVWATLTALLSFSLASQPAYLPARRPVCRYIYLSVSLPTCLLPACPPAYVWLFVCLGAVCKVNRKPDGIPPLSPLTFFLPILLSACLSACFPACLLPSLSTCLPVCLPVSLPACLPDSPPLCVFWGWGGRPPTQAHLARRVLWGSSKFCY